MIDNDYDAIRLLDTDNMDLNIFENVEELSFIDEKVSPLVYCSCIGKSWLKQGEPKSPSSSWETNISM